MISTPSCLSRSRNARFPDITGKSVSPQVLRALQRDCRILPGGGKAGTTKMANAAGAVRLPIPSPPFGRRHESAGPDAASAGLRFVLLGSIDASVAIRHGPTLPHHPGVDVGAAGQPANREHAAVAIEAGGRAGEVAARKIILQFMRGGPSARPRLPAGIGAGL